jgi:NADH-quinone oxidoreductase subunit L
MILLAAHGRSPVIFYLALGTAFLTAFYMVRLFVVVFLGKPKSDHAKHSHESPLSMIAPLLVLAVPSAIAGYGFVSEHFFTFGEEHHAKIVPMLATGAFALGSLIAFVLYKGRSKDPIYIPLLANKFYFDELYAQIIRYTQDLLARVSGVFDRWALDAGIVRGIAAGGTYSLGFVLRFFQLGNLQAYAFLFGLGVVGIIYYVVFQ